jgi:XapX domain-containing protein
MLAYVGSLGIGLGVGVRYGLLRFRSPAPPLIALVGLLGMLAGEQAVSLLRARLAPPSTRDAAREGDPPGAGGR